MQKSAIKKAGRFFHNWILFKGFGQANLHGLPITFDYKLVIDMHNEFLLRFILWVLLVGKYFLHVNHVNDYMIL